MDRPIFLIGAARSGTKVFAQILAAHPQIAFWDEPRYVWRHGNHGARDDQRSVQEATPPVAAFIRRKFDSFVARSGRPRFLEKTPSNCFRIGFMYRIFPDGLFLHLQRDGRDVAASALQRWCSRPDDGAILRRFRGLEIPLTAFHHYAPEILRELVLRRLQPSRGYLWGPRYPGIHDDLAHLPTAEICARQWAASAKAAATGLAQIPEHQCLTIRYERLVGDPVGMLRRIQAFAELPLAPEVDAAAERMLSERGGKFERLSHEQRRHIEAICLPAMAELGMSP